MARGYYMPYVIDHTKVGAGTHTNFQLLILKTSVNLKTVANSGHVGNASGFDIAPFTDTGLTTGLDFQLKYYDATNGQVIMWVRMPTGTLPSSASDTTIYLGYGDAGITTDQSTTNFWAAYYNWGILGDGTSSIADMTGHMTITNSGADLNNAGKMYKSIRLVGSNNDYIDLPDNTYTDVTGSFTISGWFNFDNTAGGGLYYKGSSCIWDSASGKTLDFGWFTDNNIYCAISGAGNAPYAAKALTPSTGVWYHIAATWDGTNGSTALYAYLNGAAGSAGASNITAIQTNNETGRLGGKGKASTDYKFSGYFENFKLTTSCRSAGWILTEYNNQNAPNTFGSFGTEAAVGGGASGPTNLKNYHGIAKASVKTIESIAIASVKSINGIT